MEDTYFYESNKSSPNLANNYKENEGRLETIQLPNLSQLFGAGDIYTTAADIYYYDKALIQGELIKIKKELRCLLLVVSLLMV